MDEIQKLRKIIDDLQDELNKLVVQSSSLLDPEILVASKRLDAVLNEYREILKSNEAPRK